MGFGELNEMTEGPNTGLTRSSIADHRSKLLWALPLANGAGLVSLATLIGAMPDPNFAVTALTLPLFLFGAGLSLGFAALNRGHSQLNFELCAFQASDEYLRTTERIAGSSAIKNFSSLNPETLKLVVPEQDFVPLLRKLYAGLVDVEAGVWRESEACEGAIEAKIKEWRDKADKEGRAVQNLQLGSHMCCAAAIIIVLVAPMFGQTLQPNPKPVLAVEAHEPASKPLRVIGPQP